MMNLLISFVFHEGGGRYESFSSGGDTRRLEKVNLERIYLDQTGLIYNWAFFCFGILFMIFSSYLLFFVLHRHPILIVRCPKVFAFDVALNCFNCILQSMMNLNYFQLYLGCQPWTAFVDGIDVASNMISIGRAVLYYNQAATIAKMGRYPIVDRLMDIIAWFTCPEDYFRNKDWKNIVRQASTIRSLYKPSEFYDQSTYWGRFQHWSTGGGFMRCVYAITGWFLVGVSYSLISTSYGMRQAVGDPSASSPLSCWVEYLTPISPMLYFFFCILNILILIAIWDMRDSVGIRNDMVLSLSIAIFFKFVNGFFIVFPVWEISWQYTYSPAAIMSSLDSMFYLLYFVLLGSKLSDNPASSVLERIKSSYIEEDEEPIEFELRRAMMYFKGRNQVRRMNTKMERLWNTTKGKKRILELASKYYIFESLRFLGESDALLDSILIDHAEYLRFYRTYIKAGSKWQLNLSSAMCNKYAFLLEKHGVMSMEIDEPEEKSQRGDCDIEQPTTFASSNPTTIRSLSGHSKSSLVFLSNIFIRGNSLAGSKSNLQYGYSSTQLGGSAVSSKSEKSKALFASAEEREKRDHIEEFTEILFEIRREVFLMIDPMIRRDLSLMHQKEMAEKDAHSVINSVRTTVRSSIRQINSSRHSARSSVRSARDSQVSEPSQRSANRLSSSVHRSSHDSNVSRNSSIGGDSNDSNRHDADTVEAQMRTDSAKHDSDHQRLKRNQSFLSSKRLLPFKASHVVPAASQSDSTQQQATPTQTQTGTETDAKSVCTIVELASQQSNSTLAQQQQQQSLRHLSSQLSLYSIEDGSLNSRPRSTAAVPAAASVSSSPLPPDRLPAPTTAAVRNKPPTISLVAEPDSPCAM